LGRFGRGRNWKKMKKKKMYYKGDVREIDAKFAKPIFKIAHRKSLWHSDRNGR